MFFLGLGYKGIHLTNIIGRDCSENLMRFPEMFISFFLNTNIFVHNNSTLK